MKQHPILMRLGALLLCFALLVGILPAGALAADTEPAKGTEVCICDTLCTEDSVNTDCPVCGANWAQCAGESAPDAEGGEAGGEPKQPDGVAETDPAVAAVQVMIDALPTAAEQESMSQDEQAAVYEQGQAAYDAYNTLTDEQKEQITGADIFDDLFAVFNSTTNALATASGVTYLDENGNQQTAESATVVESTTTSWGEGWYVVNSNVEITARITVNGSVNLILTDGYTLTASQGITVDGSNSLTIYGQTAGTGTLTATATASSAAGIGGGYMGAGGNITINGGTVTANGNTQGAGIGGGYYGVGGNITINGGKVVANGGSSESSDAGGAGIGGGGYAAGGTITINDGTVTATGGLNSAGIGGGCSGAGGTVNITGGTVTATGNGYGEGIGRATPSTSSSTSRGSCSIGGDAVVFANADSDRSPIGNTSGSGSWNGIVFQGNSGQVYGDVTLEDDLEIPDDATLTVPEGSTLTIPEDVTVTGGITTESGGTVNNSGTVTGGVTGDGTENVPSTVAVTVNPTPATYGGSVTLTATVTGGNNTVNDGTVIFYQGDANGTVLNSGGTTVSNGSAAYTIDSIDWTPSNSPYTITAVYSGGTGLLEGSGTATLTVTLPDADIQLTVKNGNSVTTEFTYGDTITIEGTVQAASNVSTNDLTQNQVGLFLGEMPLGSTATVDSNGSFTLTYNTAGKAITPSTNAQTLTVQYGGSSALNSGETTVQITLNPKPVTAQVASGTTITKEYDGNASITVSLSIPANALVNATDNVTASASGTFAQSDVGDNISITFTNITPSGTDAAYYNISAPTDVTGSITAAHSSVTSAPAAATDLAYTGAAQPLVTAGTASNGTMVYALGTDATTAPSDNYNNTIPTGTNAGTYYVWYMVDGDLNHSDTTPLCVEVTIAKKELTVSAVTANDKTYDGTTTATGTITLSGAVSGEQPTATGTFAFAGANAGNDKTVSVTNIALEDNWGTNYALDTATATATAAISPLTATLVWSGYENLTYTGNPVNVTATVGNLMGNDQCTVTVTGGTETNVGGPYTATATSLSNSNYAMPTEGTSQTYYISAASAAVDTAPAANTALTYTGEAQTLVTAGTASNGTMVYALGNNAATAPESSSFSAAIPQGTNAGTYYVWYKAQGSGNYSDSTPACVTVTIGKASQDAPAVPPQSSRVTTTSITLNNVPASTVSGAAAEYGISRDGGESWDWQADPAFINLSSNTPYTFAIRYQETDNYNASPNSEQIQITTSRPSSSGGGGGTTTDPEPDDPTYTPGVTEPENGTVTVSPTNPKEGDTVTVTTQPEDRYKVDTITVTDEDGVSVDVTQAADNTYTFTQPEGDVTITVTFDVDMPFTDVPENAWYIEGAKYAYAHYLMNGTSETTFSPSTPVSRGMIMQILYNMVGQPNVEGGSSFTDVSEGYWSADAIAWAVENGVAGGFGDGTFRPDDNLTREQMAVILRNFAYQMGWDISATGDLSRFTDIAEDSWARDALAWAFAEGLLTGTSESTMDPTGQASRAQIAVIMMRFCERYGALQ